MAGKAMASRTQRRKRLVKKIHMVESLLPSPQNLARSDIVKAAFCGRAGQYMRQEPSGK
jgi:hypothetical protein